MALLISRFPNQYYFSYGRITSAIANHHLPISFSRKHSSSYERRHSAVSSRNAWIGATVLGVAIGYGFWKLSEHSHPKFLLKANAASPDKPHGGRRTGEPVFSMAEVGKHKTEQDGIWVTYSGVVYDITKFVDIHPGGKSKLMLAAGSALEPYWDIYSVHKSPEIVKLLEKYRIGVLKEEDVTARVAKSAALDDPFRNDPARSPALKVVSPKPFNAETPLEILVDQDLTPNDIFFIRNHLPVPEINVKSFRLNVEGPSSVIKRPLRLTVEELGKQFQQHTTTATVMCTGNRRTDMNIHKPVKGLAWDAGAISTAEWRGVRLRDLLAYAMNVSVEKLTPQYAQEKGIRHVCFEGLDTDESGQHYGASIPVEIALDPMVDSIIAIEMNGKELPPDHGYPLRVIVPGIVGARQVKWLSKIILSGEESPSFWQRKDYKTFSPSVDLSQLDYSSATAIMEPCVQSAICVPANNSILSDEGAVTVKGYAWSGGGRGILRVEVSIDDGETWHTATLHPVGAPPDEKNTPLRGQWAWTLWEAEIPLMLADNEKERKVQIICKAVDVAQNSQPESYKGTWNVRGLMANAWHRVNVQVKQT